MQFGYCHFQFQAPAYYRRHLCLYYGDEAVASPLYSTALDPHKLSIAGTPIVVPCTEGKGIAPLGKIHDALGRNSQFLPINLTVTYVTLTH